MRHNLNFGFFLRFSDREVELIKAGVPFPKDEMRERIKEAIREAYEFPVLVHFRADPKLLRKSAKEIIDGDPIISFNLDSMADEAFESIKNLDLREEDRWWRKTD
jgi:hypothetical protein